MSRSDASSILDALSLAVDEQPRALALRTSDGSSNLSEFSNADVFTRVLHRASAYSAVGLEAGDRVILAVPSGIELVVGYFAAMSMGAIPLIISPDRGMCDLLYCENVHDVMESIGASIVVTCNENLNWLRERFGSKVFSSQIFGQISTTALPPRRFSSSDVAHLQQTSGSTGKSRFVAVTHGNIKANVQAIGERICHSGSDSLLSWLPMFHDMGLIGLCYSAYWSCPFTLVDTSMFVRNPMIWLHLMSQYRATLSPAPASALQTCARLAARRIRDEMDLSSWRIALCGAESVQPDVVRFFESTLRKCSLRPNTVLPVYGLAECTLAATIPAPSVPMTERLVRSTQASILEDSVEYRSSVACVGNAMRNHQIRIVDDAGLQVPESVVGNVEMSGPSVVDRYFDRSGFSSTDKTADGFLQTGDLGFLEGACLFISGRKKDVIISRGRNVMPDQIEAFVERHYGSFICGCAAVGVFDVRAATETVHIVVEQKRPLPNCNHSESQLKIGLELRFAITGVTIHWKERNWLPRTSSGKIRRFQVRERLMSAS